MFLDYQQAFQRFVQNVERSLVCAVCGDPEFEGARFCTGNWNVWHPPPRSENPELGHPLTIRPRFCALPPIVQSTHNGWGTVDSVNT